MHGMDMAADRIAEFPGAPRRGVAALTRLAYAGADLLPLYASLTRGCRFDEARAGDVMDLAILSQLLGDADGGLRLQSRILDVQRLYRLSPAPVTARLRLLCFAAEMDIGGNTPIEFLVESRDIELLTLYLRDGEPLPAPLPQHDAAMVIMPDDARCALPLALLECELAAWRRPVINRPSSIRRLDRDRLWRVLHGLDGVLVPQTLRLNRDDNPFGRLSSGRLVARPVGSHAGRGLALIESNRQWADYLARVPDRELFVSPFAAYRSDDGLFRKYRVVLIDGRAYPVHMAIGTDWKLWYLNAEMEQKPGRRREEQIFMDDFDTGFGKRHGAALAGIAAGTGLDYFGIDCAEMPDGRLLIFEADNTLIVHDMDPPSVFPYKGRHMRRLFEAFQSMLSARAKPAA